MAELRLQDIHKKTGPSGNVTRRLTIHQCCMYRTGVKCSRSQECACREAGRDCTANYPSNEFLNKGPSCIPPPGGRPQSLTDPRITTNMNQNIGEASFARSSSRSYFTRQPSVHTLVLTDGVGWTILLSCTSAAYMSHALTETAASNNATSAAIDSGKINSNDAQPTEFTVATPTGMSRWWPVMERVMETQNILSCPKTLR